MKVLITSNSFGKFDEAPRERMLDLGWELLDNRYHHIMSEEEMMNEVPGVDAIIDTVWELTTLIPRRLKKEALLSR